jgi:hypothetical protein
MLASTRLRKKNNFVVSRIQRNTEPYVSVYIYTERVSRVADMTAGDDFLVFVIKTVHIDMWPILNVYGVTAA